MSYRSRVFTCILWLLSGAALAQAPVEPAPAANADPVLLALIVLTNFDPPAAERVARELRGWLGASDE